MKRCPYCTSPMNELALVCACCGRDYPAQGSPLLTAERLQQLAAIRPHPRVRWVLALAALALAAVTGWLAYFSYSRAAYDQMQRMEGTRAAQSVSIAQEAINLTAMAGEKDGLLRDQQATLEAVQTQAAQAAALSAVELANASLHQVRLCKEGMGRSWDYASNEAINTALADFAVELGGELTEKKVEKPWNVDYLTVNTYKNKYALMFLVYYDKQESGFNNSIYWVEMGCYLDLR